MRFPQTSRTARSSKGFSLVEILVTTAIMGILAALLMGSVRKASSSAKDAKCISNLRQVGIGMMTYVAENNGCLPRATIEKEDPDAIDPATGKQLTADYMWSKQLGPYLPQQGKSVTAAQNKVFVCPAANYTGFANSAITTSYNSSSTLSYYKDLGNASEVGSFNQPYYSGRPMSSVENPSKTILVAEGKFAGGAFAACQSSATWPQANADLKKASSSTTKYLDYRHGDRMNVTYADGHVGTLLFKDRAQILQANWEGRLY